MSNIKIMAEGETNLLNQFIYVLKLLYIILFNNIILLFLPSFLFLPKFDKY